MKKILYLLLLSSPILQAQQIDLNIKNARTSKHVNIPFTNLYIIPPAGFDISQTFSGLKKNDLSYFLVEETPGANFFSRNIIDTQSENLLLHQEITVNDYSGEFVVRSSGPDSKSFIMEFGDSTFRNTIVAANPISDNQTEEKIIESFNSVYFDKREKIDPFNYAKFVIDDSQSKFKFYKLSYRSYLYTIAGLENAMSTRSPVASISQFARQKKMTMKEIVSQISVSHKIFNFKPGEAQNIIAPVISDHEVYENATYGELDGKEVVFYYYILMKGDQVVSFSGVAKMNFQESVNEFRLLAHTLRIK